VIEEMAERLYGPSPAWGRRRTTAKPIPLEHLVQSCFDQTPARYAEEEWFLLSQLEETLKRFDPSFTPRCYGFGSLSALIRGHPTLFATRRRSARGRPMEVCLLRDGNEEQAVQV
jgi:OST-HTH/LOTUS domain